MFKSFCTILIIVTSPLSLGLLSPLFAHGHGGVQHFHADGDEHDHHHDEHDHEHEHEGLIALNLEQIAQANIQTAEANPQVLNLTISLPGQITIDANRYAYVTSLASGIVVDVSKHLGETVKTDEVIAVLDSKEMAEAKAAYLTALKKEELAHQKLAMEEQLKAKKVSSGQDYQQASFSFQEARIEKELSKQKLYAIGLTEKELEQLPSQNTLFLRRYEVKSPLSGSIVKRDIVLGQMVGADQELFRVADLNSLWVKMDVYPKDLPLLHINQKVHINALNNERIAEGIIAYINPLIDDQTKTATAIVKLPNVKRDLFPGSFVCACAIVEEINVPLAVVKEAIQHIEGEDCLFVVEEEGFKKKCVRTGKSDGQWIEIISGLEPQEEYVTQNAFLLKAELGKSEAGHDH